MMQNQKTLGMVVLMFKHFLWREFQGYNSRENCKLKHAELAKRLIKHTPCSLQKICIFSV